MQRPDRQQIRLALVLNGGVSLAVWISRVVLEMHRLVQASRCIENRERDGYTALLDLLDAHARVDVISGTSAGGLTGGFLDLALVHGCDLSGLRDLWRHKGDLGALLRDPRQEKTPSVVRGEYFHEQLVGAYRTVLASADRRRAAPEAETVDVYLTGTLWAGRDIAFADDMGRRIVEVDHDATFHFSSDPEVFGGAAGVKGDLREYAGLAAQLGVASRCTSSFPGAFEPCWVDVLAGQRVGDRWQSSAGRANYTQSQFVVDGGLLLNKPIRPAIEAVYRQSAAQQVRRILAYVVPDPGEVPATRPAPRPGGAPAAATPVPDAGDVVPGVLTRLRSTDSVSRELAEIQRRNDDARYRRRTRDRLAAALIAAGAVVDGGADGERDLVAGAFPGYREVRKESAARTVSEKILAVPGDTLWSQCELAAEQRDLTDAEVLPFIPGSDFAEAMNGGTGEWRWGLSTVRQLGYMVVDVFRRAVWLAPLGDEAWKAIVAARADVHVRLRALREVQAELDAFWAACKRALPARSDQPTATPDELKALRESMSDVVRTRSTAAPRAEDTGDRLWEHALGLAAVHCSRSRTPCRRRRDTEAAGRARRPRRQRAPAAHVPLRAGCGPGVTSGGADVQSGAARRGRPGGRGDRRDPARCLHRRVGTRAAPPRARSRGHAHVRPPGHRRGPDPPPTRPLRPPSRPRPGPPRCAGHDAFRDGRDARPDRPVSRKR